MGAGVTSLVRTFGDARHRYHGSIGLVPTMGFLHEGHLSLIERARRECDTVVVTVFVNPLQFDRDDDLAAYPRDLERDVGLAGPAGADLVVAPSAEEMYPIAPLTRVTVDRITEPMEGRHRPGHFAGVTTVVAKLFAGLRPDRAYFGRKDAQQLVAVTRMAADLSFPLEVVGCSVVREEDGLALSSRNVRIPPGVRTAATGLSRGLAEAAGAVEAGERSAAVLRRLVAGAAGGLDLDYVELAAAEDAAPLDTLDRPAFLAVAATAGPVRLIDNVWFGLSDGVPVADVGTRLPAPSILYRR